MLTACQESVENSTPPSPFTEKASTTAPAPTAPAPVQPPHADPKPPEATPGPPQPSPASTIVKPELTAVPVTGRLDPAPQDLRPELTPEEYAKRAEELLAVVVGDSEQKAREKAQSGIIDICSRNLIPAQMAAEVYRQCFDDGIRRGYCSTALAELCARKYRQAGQMEKAIACLEDLIQFLNEGKLEIQDTVTPLMTPEARAAFVKDLRSMIEEWQQRPARSTRNAESITKLLSSSLGAINAPSDAPEAEKAEYEKARQAAKAREFAKAEEILLALGDREAAAAALAWEARNAPNAIELYDKLIVKYSDTKQAELAFYQKAFVYRDQGDQTRYLAALKEYLSRYPDGLRKLEALNELAQAAERDGRYDDAISAREKLREAHREKKIVWVMNVMALEQAYRKKGDLNSVKRLLENTIAQVEDPESQLYALQEKDDSELSRYNYLEQLRKTLAEMNKETQAAAEK